MRCATTSRTRHARAAVGRCQSSASSARRTATSSLDNGWNNKRVSVSGSDTTGFIEILLDASCRLRTWRSVIDIEAVGSDVKTGNLDQRAMVGVPEVVIRLAMLN